MSSKHVPHIFLLLKQHLKALVVFTLLFVITVGLIMYAYITNTRYTNEFDRLTTQANSRETTLSSLSAELKTTMAEYEKLKNEDQFKRNEALQEEIANIQKTYKDTITSYENILDLGTTKNKEEYDKLFAQIMQQLSERKYSSAQATLTALNKKVGEEQQARIAAASPGNIDPASVPANNTPPGSGYSRQAVKTEAGSFVVDVIAADLGSTRVIVDTASDSDCRDGCPTLSLGDYVSRNGAYAGINGTYFCPASYPSCAGKTNSFDLLVMNKNKHYFNSDNNVYSTNPAFIFSGSVRVVGRTQEWGRDTGVDAVISNYPLLVSGGNVTFGGDDDPKKGSVGIRSFVANKGNTVYIGVVRGATVAGAAHALKAMGMENAMNLDSGGSTALWYGGYKAGPGRAIPNALLFVRR